MVFHICHSTSVIDQVIDQFGYLAPVANQSFRTLVVQLAFNVIGEWFSQFLSLHKSHHHVGSHEPAQMWKTTNLRAATSRH